jgi:hypothetical protein
MPAPTGYPNSITLNYDLGDGSGAQSAVLPWGDQSYCDGQTANLQPVNLPAGTWELTGEGLALGDTGFADQVIFQRSGNQLSTNYPDGGGKVDWPHSATFQAIALS